MGFLVFVMPVSVLQHSCAALKPWKVIVTWSLGVKQNPSWEKKDQEPEKIRTGSVKMIDINSRIQELFIGLLTDSRNCGLRRL